jgi:hypothetical protein
MNRHALARLMRRTSENAPSPKVSEIKGRAGRRKLGYVSSRGPARETVARLRSFLGEWERL